MEKPDYATKLERKITALHDKEMPWQELLQQLNADDELCFLDDWSNKPPKELRESLGQMGQYMAHLVEEDALAKQLTAVSLAPASVGPGAGLLDASNQMELHFVDV